MKLTGEQVEELKELLDHHEQYGSCKPGDECCSSDLHEFLRDVVADA